MEKIHFLPIGKIVGVHGIKGTVRIYSYVESLSVFKPGGTIRAKNLEGEEKTYIVEWVKTHKRHVLGCFKGIESRELAERLIGSILFIEKKNLPDLEEGTYYWVDLIGLSVYTIDGKYIGRLEAIIPTGSNDVYVVKDLNQEDGREILIPAIESVIVEINLERNMMRVDLPNGL